jgi:uncharacterized protein YunC (DUF1805 family)
VNSQSAKRSRLQLRHTHCLIFCASGDCGYTDYNEYYINHDDHGYITIGYLDIDIKGNVYSNSSAITSVNSVRVVTCVHNFLAMTAGGKRGGTERGGTEKTPEGTQSPS